MEWENYPKHAWNGPSFAVVANDDLGSGCVLWTGGPHVRFEIEEGGSHTLADLGLDNAPVGISIWEGIYVWWPGGYESPDDGGSKPAGIFRKPTENEWKAIKQGVSPWDETIMWGRRPMLEERE